MIAILVMPFICLGQSLNFSSGVHLSNLTSREGSEGLKVNSYRLGWSSSLGIEREVIHDIGFDLRLRYINRKPIERYELVGSQTGGTILFVGLVQNLPTHSSYAGFDPLKHNQLPNSQYLELHFQPSFSFTLPKFGKLKVKAGGYAAYLLNSEQMKTSVEEFGPEIVEFVESFSQLVSPPGVEYSPGDLGISGGVSYIFSIKQWGEFSLNGQFSRGTIRVQENTGVKLNSGEPKWKTFEFGVGYNYPIRKASR
ncbi:MAG: hypothetical protein AB8F78_04380 [Saprospiraceae bacterium]